MDTSAIVEQLKQERGRISEAIAALEGHSGGNGRRSRRPGRKQKTKEVGTATAFPFGAAKTKRSRRKVSAAVKRRLSEAAKARWAKAKKAGKNSL
jgi:hypothetical protein